MFKPCLAALGKEMGNGWAKKPEKKAAAILPELPTADRDRLSINLSKGPWSKELPGDGLAAPLHAMSRLDLLKRCQADFQIFAGI
jgi:hypothetical protein